MINQPTKPPAILRAATWPVRFTFRIASSKWVVWNVIALTLYSVFAAIAVALIW